MDFYINQGARMDHDDNIFDDDDALDYVMPKEVEKEIKQPGNQSGCLGFVALLILTPICLLK